ncbi:SNF2 family N-terminal domain-containing protein [Lentinula raphanica]|nr:SNF2 family N-terminal domain-containing protein [Lentinula raphanica]
MYANGGMANMQSRPGLSDLQQMIAKANFLRKNPTEQKSPTELENLMKQIQALGARQTQIQQQSQSQAEVSFTPDQINVLRAQIHAFRLLSRGVPLPEGLHQAVQLNSTVIPDLEKLLQAPDTSSRIVDSAVKVSKTPDIIPKTEEQADVLPINPADMPKGPFLEDDVNSGIYPYNAYRHPFSQLKRHRELDPAMFATRLQRLLVPTIMPPGLDAQQILNERDRYIEARIQQRMRELESIPSTNDLIEESMPDSESPLTFPATSNGKLSALIELKSLRLIEKQQFRRTRKPTIRDARTTEQLEPRVICNQAASHRGNRTPRIVDSSRSFEEEQKLRGAQQNEGGGLRDLHYETEEVSTDEPQDKAKVDYYAITRQPSILLKGLQWMGLGKTIQTISLISFLIEAKNQRGPYLVIVPLSTMTNWSGESLSGHSYQGHLLQRQPGARRALQGDLRVGGFHVLLTTYEYIIKDRPVLSKMKWLHMIIDEGHRMKNTQSKLAQTLTTYYTPNNLPELWALLNFALPKVFNSVKSFDEWFNTPFATLNEEEALLIIRRLHKVLRPFLLRRLKKDVESELPDKVEKVIKTLKGGKSGGVKGLSNELMQLRKICQHPFLFESVEDKVNPSGVIDERIDLSLSIIKAYKGLIFFQMTKVMDIMADFLRFLNVQNKTEERASFVTLFNAKESEYKVFILSTRAGGLGLNLQTADTVIMNPHADLQAQDRAHRIGQTKASVEEAMYQRARYKLDIDDKVIQAGRFDNKSTQEEQEELLVSTLSRSEEENEEAGDMNDEELNALISRSDEEAEPPQPLIQLEELPEYAEELIEGRGQRKRNVVSYNDGLDDDTWAMALEEGEDLQELTDKTRERKERRATNKLLREAEASNRGTPASDTESRGPCCWVETKRGGMKSMSVTPSIADDDDDDERDQKRRKTKTADLSPAIREKMKKAFNECYKAVLACEAEDGRKRCELFREVPDRRDYPDYYQLIKQPIALSQIRKRSQGNFYKDVSQYKADWKLMFNNARTYNQEGSWVYNDAEEMEKVFNAMYDKQINGSGLPGAPSTGSGSGSNASYESALTPMEDDERPPPPTKSRGSGRKQVLSDEEYLTPSDDE